MLRDTTNKVTGVPQGPYIVLVEDEPAHTDLILAGLLEVGIKDEILHLENGATALDLLRHYPRNRNTPQPRLFILDLHLPDIDGVEILKEIKASELLGSIPVVILSTSNTIEDRSRASEHGADGYFTKPLDFDDLCNVLGEICTRWLS